MLFKHPIASAVMLLSLSATSSNANLNLNHTHRPSHNYVADVHPPTYEVSVPQLPPSGIILVHDAKKILNLVVRSLPKQSSSSSTTSTIEIPTSVYEDDEVIEPTVVANLRKAVTKVEESALSEDDWNRMRVLIRSIIEEYGNPTEETEPEQEPTVVDTIVEVTKDVVEEIVMKRTPGQVMATALAVSAIVYETAQFLFF